MRTLWQAVAAAAGTLLVATACGGTAGSSTGSQQLVDHATMTIAINEDPGNLDPQNTVLAVDGQLAAFAYDPLVNENGAGKPVSGLAQTWQQSGNSYRFTLRPGITCSDGSKLTATTVAANFSYLADPKNKSPLLGLYVPPGLTAVGDNAARTVTLTLKGPFPFFLSGISSVAIVCQKGLAHRALLAQHTDGTGPYQLTTAVPGASYTYAVRPGYSWGPGGASTKAAGMPSTVAFKVVTNTGTAANLLLNGQVNIASIGQADAPRVNAAGLPHHDLLRPAGEMFFNESHGHPTADPRVRRALVMAVNLSQLGKVLTSGAGQPSQGMVTVSPKPCAGDPVRANLPAHNLAQANALLQQAGWVKGADGLRHKGGQTLSLQLMYGSTLDNDASAAELAVSQWRAAGVKVTAVAKPVTQISTTLFSTGTWDISWAPLTVQFPSQLVPFLSGPVPPNGTNFGHVSNPGYDRLSQQASAMSNTSGCPHWLAAEADLVRNADVVPYYDAVTPTYEKNARFSLVGGGIVATSLRRLAG